MKITLTDGGVETDFDVDFMKKGNRVVAIVAPVGPGGKPINANAVCGVAECSDKDEFDIVHGKRLALQRFVDMVQLPEEHKKVLWAAFVKVHVTPHHKEDRATKFERESWTQIAAEHSKESKRRQVQRIGQNGIIPVEKASRAFAVAVDALEQMFFEPAD